MTLTEEISAVNDSATTHSPDAPEETDKTDETDFVVTNATFFESLFHDLKQDIHPIIVRFMGNPQTVPKSFWSGMAWKPDIGELSPNGNNYFSLAVFRPDEAGIYRRRKNQFHALHAVMLDDIGTKVERDRVTLPPSWMLETSEGNYQAGYIFAEPLTDVVVVDRLMDAIIAAQLCDKGANGATARLARLPQAVNGKHDPVFPCRMVEWHPERRYTVEDIVDGLQLDMRPSGRAKANTKERQHREQQEDGEPIYIPCDGENPVIVALKSRNLYKSPLGEGKHDITCPWVEEHTDAVDGGTAYFEPDDTYQVGGFKCMHGHCQHRHIKELLEFLSVATSAARMKSTIRLVAGDIHRIVDAAERELAKSGRHYQRGGVIVTISTDQGTKETIVCPVPASGVVVALAGAALWERYDKRAESWVRIDPPERHTRALFDATSYKHLPALHDLTRQPYLRPDGSLMTVAGYDALTGMFGVFAELSFGLVLIISTVRTTIKQKNGTQRLQKRVMLRRSFGSGGCMTSAGRVFRKIIVRR